jgi:hypothetical protein
MRTKDMTIKIQSSQLRRNDHIEWLVHWPLAQYSIENPLIKKK